MQQYSTDLREAAVHALDTGASATEVAHLLGVSRRSVLRWDERRQLTGSVAASPRPGPIAKLTPAARVWLQQRVADHPDAPLHDHRAALAEVLDIQISESTMSRTMARLGITHKKRA
jgi:transposase